MSYISLNRTETKTSIANIQPIVPMSRVKTIMKSSPEISIINQDTLYLVCKATVLIFYSVYAFMVHLSKPILVRVYNIFCL